MAWYDDRTRVSYVAKYKNEKAIRRDLEQAMRRGWRLQDTSQVGGHLNLGRTAAGVMLTGGLALLAGGSRTKGSHTVVFVRDELWLVRAEVEEAHERVLVASARVDRTDSHTDAGCDRVTRCWRTAKEPDWAPHEETEKALREALQELTKSRRVSVRMRDALIQEVSGARKAQKAASAAGVSMGGPGHSIVEAYAELKSEQSLEQLDIEAETAAVAEQIAVEHASKMWEKLDKRHAQAVQRKTDAEQRLANEADRVRQLPNEGQQADERKLQSLREQVERYSFELERADTELAEAEERLDELVAKRDKAFEQLRALLPAR